MVSETPDVHRSFTAAGAADPHTVARLRDAVSDWVDGVVPVDDQRRADILLATDEAMSNCADHAYPDRSGCGEMSVELTFHREAAKLEVRVADDGEWLDPEQRPVRSGRGRGIKLMKALADDVRIDGSATGTVVHLRFVGCVVSRCA